MHDQSAEQSRRWQRATTCEMTVVAESEQVVAYEVGFVVEKCIEIKWKKKKDEKKLTLFS